MLVSGGIMLFFRVIWAIACLSFLYSIPFKAQAEIIFNARVNNNDVKLLLDTGSEMTLLFNKTASRLKLNVIKRNSSNSVDPGKVGVDVTEECDFQLGSTQYKGRLHVYTPPDWFDAGVDYIIDGPNNNLYMKPNNVRTSQYAYNRLGAVFVPDDISAEYLYAHVVEGSPAYIAGLRNRDILTRVNELDVTKWKTDPRVLP
jgi:hypothetical protein